MRFENEQAKKALLQIQNDAIADCAYGCPNKRKAERICCDVCWRLVPRAMKREFWDACEDATSGRGWKKNGRQTPRLSAAVKAIVDFIGEKVSRPFALELNRKALEETEKRRRDQQLDEGIDAQERERNEKRRANANAAKADL